MGVPLLGILPGGNRVEQHGETRVDVPVGIAYKEYIPKARAVLLKMVEGVEGVPKEPAPDIVVTELGDSSVNLHVRV